MISLVLAALFYVSQESLSIALENVKAGSVATFGYISVIINHFGYKFYEQIKLKKGGHEHLPRLNLAQITLEAPSRATFNSLELFGLAMILGFSALHAISLMMEKPNKHPIEKRF